MYIYIYVLICLYACVYTVILYRCGTNTDMIQAELLPVPHVSHVLDFSGRLVEAP